MNAEVLNKHRMRKGPYGSNPEDGFNGAFFLRINGLDIKVIASDGEGWQHVSVSHAGPSHFEPSWSVMSKVKDLFWEPDQVVIQIHPARSNYVNNHPGCLHLWRCTDGRDQPLPPSIMVGLMDLNAPKTP